jgi:hypothetical protein
MLSVRETEENDEMLNYYSRCLIQDSETGHL